MTAREKFSKGDRVRLSAEGEERFSRRRSAHTGVVVGFGHVHTGVSILRDGTKTREAWHMDFWEVVTDDGTR